MQGPESLQVAYQNLADVATVLIAGSGAALLAKQLRVPDIVLFLAAGILLGPAATGLLLIPADSATNQFILIFGASYILFDGGALLRLPVLKQVWLSLVLLATVGVVISAAVTGYAAHLLFGMALPAALLLGFVLAPTDPAALVPMFKQVKVREKVAQTVTSESAFNDAVGAIMTFALLGIAMGTERYIPLRSLVKLVHDAGMGVMVGAAVGYCAAFLIGHRDYALLRDNMSVVSLIVVVTAYMLATTLDGSGFMAVFIAGVVLGNNELFGFAVDAIDEHKLHDYVETTGLIFRMFIFILLGSHVDFAAIGDYLLPALGVCLVFMFVARPLTVFLCTLLDRKAAWTLREKLFMCWTRETGVIPGALAGMLAGMGAPNADVISSVTFVAILLTIGLQATTTRWVARRLGLLEA